jgi:CDP-glucose 4,6-dehydratase
MSGKYFKDKNVLITGIGGFVGSHLAERLLTLGSNIYGISKTQPQVIINAKKILRVNIVDHEAISRFIKDSKINICFHLAGESLVESGQKNPYSTYKVNIEGTLNILESALKHKMDKVIIASTSHVYGKNKVPYFESYMPRPTRPYETSKACTDLIAQSYAETFNIPVLIPRFVNIYGPGDLNFYRLIPKTIKSVLFNKSPKMWGGDILRDYMYVDDAIEAYLMLAKIDIEKVKGGRVFNFGSSNVISVSNLIKKIIKISDRPYKIDKIEDYRVGEIKSQYVSCRKANKLLGWEPKVSLDDGLAKTIKWYKHYFNDK